MDRRTFIKRTLYYGTAVSSYLLFGGWDKIIPIKNLTGKSLAPDLIALKGSTPEKMFDKGIALLGSMKKFVNKGQTVVVKPNIAWDRTPEQGANTDPGLVGRIIEHCLAAGAKKVYVFDHTCNNWKNTYKNSGIEYAVKEKGGQIVSGDSKSYYHSVNVPDGTNLKKVDVHELILESDVFINVPVLKDHSGATMTMAMKNLMGVVWNRGYYHSNNLHQCIADFTTVRKPDLNVVDAYRVMMDNGPRGYAKSDIEIMKTQLISTDIVAVDTAAVKVFGRNPDDIDYIKMAYDKKAGNMNLDQLKIERVIM